MSASSSDYYSLEKTAEVLGLPAAEVNRLREKSMLRAFRDGVSWKFRKADVDNYLAETIKNRGKKDPDAEIGNDSGFDLLNSGDDSEEAPTLLADSASFDTLMEEGDGLAINEGLVDVKPTVQPKVLLNKSAVPQKQPGKSDVDLADDDGLVLADGGHSSNLDLAGDSGLSLMNLAEEDLKPSRKGGSDVNLELNDDDDILSLMDDSAFAENTSAVDSKEDDFQIAGDEEDTALTATSPSTSSAAPISPPMPDFTSAAPPVDFGTFNAPESDITNDMFNGAVPASETPFAAASAFTDATAPADGVFTAPTANASAFSGDFASAPSTFSVPPVKTEAEYKAVTVIGLIVTAVLMVFPGIMLFDLIRNIWSWQGPFVINSTLMDMIVGMVLK